MEQYIPEIVSKGNNEIEKYLSLYKQYKEFYKEDKKMVVIYQLGDFYEIYSIQYPKTSSNQPPKREGNLWEVAEELELVISQKKAKVFNKPEISVFMGGIPIRSIDKHLQTAINKGWTVIIYNQIEKRPNSYVREFDRIVSPGTNMIGIQETNNMIVLYMEKVSSILNPGNPPILYVGIAFLDTLTGEIGTIQYPLKEQIYDEVIYDEIIKLITIKNPRDILIYADKCNLTEKEIVDKLHLNFYNHKIYIDGFPSDFTKKTYQENLFNNIYNVDNSLTSQATKQKHIFNTLGINDYIYCRMSLTTLFEYIIKRNQSLLLKLQKPTLLFEESSNLILQNNSLEQLNIVNNIKKNYHFEKRLSLLTLLDNTKTTIGKRTFRNQLMNPITNKDILNERYENINVFMMSDELLQQDIINLLTSITDINKQSRKIANYTFKYTDIISFLKSIKSAKELNEKLTTSATKFVNVIPQSDDLSKLNNYIKDIECIFNIEYLNDNNNLRMNDLETNIFNKGINVELDKLQDTIDTDKTLIDEIVRKLTIMIDDEFYSKKKDKNGTKYLINKCENAKFNTYITASKSRIEIIKKKIEKNQSKYGYGIAIGHYKIQKKDFYFEQYNRSSIRIDLSCIRTSGTNLIQNIKLLNTKTVKAFHDIMDDFYEKYNDVICKYVRFIGKLDVVQSCGVVAMENGYIKPTIKEDYPKSFIDVREIRHPLIEKIQTDVQYIGNDICLGKEKQNGILLFGVNAVGKSSLMKSIGCCIIMAQAGMFVPASSFHYYPFKYLFTRICSNDNIFAGMSTFEVEMSEMKTIMNYADENGIILGDEICSGTETMDATAIVASCIDILATRKSNFLFATHLHYLASSKYITKLENVCCKHMSVIFDEKNKQLVYERKLQDGSGPSSYGIEVCKSMGMMADFMEIAQNIRNSLSDNIQMITGKQSKYNKEKFISKCEVCMINVAVDTHHIKFQCSADKDTGMIGQWHKDNKFNLVGLCKECHQSVHSSPPRLTIDGYISTSQGIKLDYKRIDNNNNKKIIVNIEQELQNNNNNNNNNLQDKSDEDNSDEKIEKIIKNYKSRNMTPKQIQNRLKEENITMTQKKIKSYF